MNTKSRSKSVRKEILPDVVFEEEKPKLDNFMYFIDSVHVDGKCGFHSRDDAVEECKRIASEFPGDQVTLYRAEAFFVVKDVQEVFV